MIQGKNENSLTPQSHLQYTYSNCCKRYSDMLITEQLLMNMYILILIR